MTTVGYHYIVEATGCSPAIIGDPARTREILLQAARVGRMEVKTSYFFKFNPHGISGMLIIAESHISIHAWPEDGYAAVDVYVCGKNANPEKAIDSILEAFEARHAHITEIKRGVKDEDIFTHTLLTWEENPRTGDEG